MSRWLKHSRRHKSQRANARPRLLRFEDLENRRVLSGTPIDDWWEVLELGEAAEYGDENDREEQYEQSRYLTSLYATGEDDEGWERNDDDESDERDDDHRAFEYNDDDLYHDDDHDDDRWETEEDHTTTTVLADNLIRSSLPPVVSSSTKTRDDIEAESGIDDVFSNTVRNSQENGSGLATSNSENVTSLNSREVGSNDATFDSGGDGDGDAEDDRDSDGIAADGDEYASTSQVFPQNPDEDSTSVTADTSESVPQPIDTADLAVGTGVEYQLANEDNLVEDAIAPVRPETDADEDFSIVPDWKMAEGEPVDRDSADVRSKLNAWPAAGSWNLRRHENTRLSGASTAAGKHWHLMESIPQDLAGLERALHSLLHDEYAIGKSLLDRLIDPNVLGWVLASSIAVVALDTVRRQTRRAKLDDERSVENLPLDSNQAALLRLFPELFGLAPTRKP